MGLQKQLITLTIVIHVLTLCNAPLWGQSAKKAARSKFVLGAQHVHNKFSRSIEPVLRVPPGVLVQVTTREATDGQLTVNSVSADVPNVKFDPIHPLSGPVYVEGAKKGDVLAVTLREFEILGWGWTGVFPGFGFLADEFDQPYLKTFMIPRGARSVGFSGAIRVPLNPFAGVMGVAPDTDSLLSTIPPRANGGNMDNPYLTVGTTVYFPVFVDGALFSIGDTHAAQGMGEVCGTGIEAPMTVVFEVNVMKNMPWLREPQYETNEDYAVTAFATTLDKAAKKATRFMIDYLEAAHGLDRTEAYVLCSIAADLKIAEVVDVPHVLVSMHISKRVLGQ